MYESLWTQKVQATLFRTPLLNTKRLSSNSYFNLRTAQKIQHCIPSVSETAWFAWVLKLKLSLVTSQSTGHKQLLSTNRIIFPLDYDLKSQKEHETLSFHENFLIDESGQDLNKLKYAQNMTNEHMENPWFCGREEWGSQNWTQRPWLCNKN